MRISDWSSDVCSSDLQDQTDCIDTEGDSGGEVAGSAQATELDARAEQSSSMVQAHDPGKMPLRGETRVAAVSGARILPDIAAPRNRGRDRKSTRLNSSH